MMAVKTGYIKCIVVATPLDINWYPQNKNIEDTLYIIPSRISAGISFSLIFKEVFLINKMVNRIMQAKKNLYSNMEGNFIPSAITGRVNKGINPNVADEIIP